ncbi:MAG: hypothetical protein JO297_00315 [Nitrososphaeraceae archaeon]|nr:hypothetical protein [Nitrososphaeraceae archaeon]
MSNRKRSGSGLTEQEILEVKKIVAGISEILNNIMTSRNPKDYADSLSGPQRRSRKSRTHIPLYFIT